VKGFDPQAMQIVKEILPELTLCKNPYEVAEGADAILLATEWNEFKSLDFKQIKETMRGSVIVDGRNIWDENMLRSMGFVYYGVGIPNPK
jgi:UDPglucose 6-dehydrogenase